MIKQEPYGEVDGRALVHTFSDDGMMIEQNDTGILYIDAIDPVLKGVSYTETDIPVPKWDEELPEPEGGWDTPPEEWPDPEEGGEDLEELGVPEELIEEEVEDDAEPEDPDGPLPIPEELVR